jgi:hypothetical protein
VNSRQATSATVPTFAASLAWPPEAGRWDRTLDDLVQLEAARAAIGPLMGIRRRQEELQALCQVVDAAWRWSDLTCGRGARRPGRGRQRCRRRRLPALARHRQERREER